MIEQSVFEKIKQKQGATNPLHDPEMSQEYLPQDDSLGSAVVRSLHRYFQSLRGNQPHELYPMVIGAVEASLLEYVMNYCGHNQCVAAQLLGMNRNTLRKKLQTHKLI